MLFENFNQANLNFERLRQKHASQKRRFDAKFHKYVQKITTSSVFNAFIMAVIVINALTIGLETDDEIRISNTNLFKALDELFLAIYTMEFLMKLYAEPRGYWKNSYNVFDFSILAISFVQIILDELNVGDKVLTPLRLLRAARTLRTISFIEGLQVLVMALIDTIRNSVLNVVVLLVMLMVFFAVVGFYIFGVEEETGDKENWGSLSTAMLTLFAFVTVDGWTEVQKDLNERPYSQWFTVIFIFLGHFIFTNLFVGIIIMNIHEATEHFIQQQRQEREAVLQLKKDYLYQRQHNDVKEMLEKQKSSQYANFEEMTRSFKMTLRHDDYVIMMDPCTNLTWIEAFLTSTDHLDLYMHRLQQLHFHQAITLADLAEIQLGVGSQPTQQNKLMAFLSKRR